MQASCICFAIFSIIKSGCDESLQLDDLKKYYTQISSIEINKNIEFNKCNNSELTLIEISLNIYFNTSNNAELKNYIKASMQTHLASLNVLLNTAKEPKIANYNLYDKVTTLIESIFEVDIHLKL